MKVFIKETGIQLIGGNVGVTVFDYLGNYVAGLVVKDTTKNPEMIRAVVNTIVKGVGGAGVMAGAGKLNGKNKEVGNFLVGMGGGPIMTILNDWVKAIPSQGGANVGDAAFAAARARRGSMVMAAPVRVSAGVSGSPASMAGVRTAASGTTTAAAMRVGVF